jgi:hypothetical protein
MVAPHKKQKLSASALSNDVSLLKKPSKKNTPAAPVEESAESSAEESSEVGSPEEDLEDISSFDEDDDVDVAEVSSSDDEAEADSESDYDDDNIPKLKKKKNLDDGSELFANAFNAIVGSRLKAYDRKNPILARSKKSLKKLESDKLEAKAKRLLNAEKKDQMDKCRVKNLLPSADKPEKVREVIEKEKKMKKIAQRGVVRLFNAVLSTQVKTNQDISKEKVGLTRKNELMNEILKEKFLDLVQAAGET